MDMIKNRILSKREGETYINFGGEGSSERLRPAEEILCEMDNMRGLNTRERMSARTVCTKV